MKKNRSIEFNNDELFIVMGMVILNMKEPSKFVEAFTQYKRDKYKHKVTLTEDLIDELIKICNMHTNQKGVTKSTINKILMSKELVAAEYEYDKKVKGIITKYGF